MSQLHRNLLAQIMAAIDPVVEAGVAAFVPGAAPLAKVAMDAAENVADAIGGGSTEAAAAPAAPTAAAPAAPVAAASPAPTTSAPAPGSAAELALALSQVLAKYLPQ